MTNPIRHFLCAIGRHETAVREDHHLYCLHCDWQDPFDDPIARMIERIEEHNARRRDGEVWFTQEEPYGPHKIATCPDCGLGLIETHAVKPNHCPQCGYKWTKLPPPCPDCGTPQWTTGHYCSANPSMGSASEVTA